MNKILLLAGGAACLVAPGALAAARPGQAGAVLTITITNIRATTGKVHVDLCRQTEFLKTCAVIAETKPVRGTTVITLPNVQPGDYAVQATYDQNGNGKVDRGLFGIPKEGVGFSNDAPIRLGPPSWKDAVFNVSGDKAITLRMRYFSGGDNKP
ncbi:MULTISPECIES: DUF2141 domain-containing protein [Sphingomonas]|uniref:DUF2141 domain-containing protein n=1 Tax=Sphingomonas TaxID=13687 RepID=UPI0008330EA9|nr:DUF2141 domain-containing protein [Sphingomonas sp. CCH10-B3]